MTKKKRQKVYEKTGGHCGYCGKKIDIKDMQRDHMHPKRLSHLYPGNINDIENLMPSCRKCNHYKRAHSVESFRQLLLTLHGRLDKIYIYEVAARYGIVKPQVWDGTFYFEKVNQITVKK